MILCLLQSKSGGSILDDSISDKYSHLPAPLGDRPSEPDDPFTVRISLAQILTSHTPAAMATAGVPQQPSLTSSMIAPSSLTSSMGGAAHASARSNPLSWSMPSPGNDPFPPRASDPFFSPPSSSSSAAGSTSASQTLFSPIKDAASPQQSDWDVLAASPQRSAVTSPQRNASPVPPLPPRIYANVPGEEKTADAEVKKPLPPLPTNPTPRLPSTKSNTATANGVVAQMAASHGRQDSNPVERTPSFKCYDCDPRDATVEGVGGACAHPSPAKNTASKSATGNTSSPKGRSSRGERKQKSSSHHEQKPKTAMLPPEEKLKVNLPSGMHPYFGNMAKLHAKKEPASGTGGGAHEPFDWLSGAVADFTFNHGNQSTTSAPGNNFNTQSDKPAWNKNVPGVVALPKHSHESFQQQQTQPAAPPADGVRAKIASPPGRDLYGQVRVKFPCDLVGERQALTI